MVRLPPTRPIILDIKGNSLDDGPGIRTVVFFKGCPLDCSWCHNPESKRATAELSYDANECVDCRACVEACGKGAIRDGVPGRIERFMCDVCGDCVKVCPSGALSAVGRRMEVEEVALVIEKDKPFFETSGGGVTLSGGEPTMYMDFCNRLLSRLGGVGIHSIIETCGHFDLELFEEYVLPLVDAVYYDLKLFDDSAHVEHCGVSNDRILDNFTGLVSSCGEAGKELLPRIPLVPGITDTEENLCEIAGFLRRSGARKFALLEYNPLWLEKGRKLGRPSGLEQDPEMAGWMPRGRVDECRTCFEGLEVV
jgi:pyruvate formate lyase activating enzyme